MYVVRPTHRIFKTTTLLLAVLALSSGTALAQQPTDDSEVAVQMTVTVDPTALHEGENPVATLANGSQLSVLVSEGEIVGWVQEDASGQPVAIGCDDLLDDSAADETNAVPVGSTASPFTENPSMRVQCCSMYCDYHGCICRELCK